MVTCSTPRADASGSETASGRQREVLVLVPFQRLHPGLSHARPESADRVECRAMAMWPRLDHRTLRRCDGNPKRIAALISHRTKMAPKLIEKLIADKKQ
jgi:hypothetical protein